MAIPSAHTGHGVRNTNWPLWKILAGYLNRSSNMDLRQRHAAIRIGTCLKEIGVTKCLVSAGKSTGRKPSLVEKDTTAEFRSSCVQASPRNASTCASHTFRTGAGYWATSGSRSEERRVGKECR